MDITGEMMLFGPMSRRIITFILLMCPLLSAQVPPVLIPLPIRVHLVRSGTHPRLQATFDETRIRALFVEVNAIWSPAGIHFEIEAVGTLQALDVPPKKWLERDRNWVKAALPSHSFSPTAIDICFVREMGPNGFFYGEPVVVSETPEFTKVKDGAENPVARVAAHELGHVLFLQHRQDHINLMASGRNGVSLNNQEIKDARKRALEILAQLPKP